MKITNYRILVAGWMIATFIGCISYLFSWITFKHLILAVLIYITITTTFFFGISYRKKIRDNFKPIYIGCLGMLVGLFLIAYSNLDQFAKAGIVLLFFVCWMDWEHKILGR